MRPQKPPKPLPVAKSDVKITSYSPISPIPPGQVEERAASTSPIENLDSRKKRMKFQKIFNNVDRHMASGGFGSDVVAIDGSDENAVERFLLAERVFGYPDSDGTIWSNYKFYCMNNHPLLCFFFMSKNHPYTRRKRLIVLLCTAAFAVVLSYVIWNTELVPLVSVCREGCTTSETFNVTNSTNSSSTSDCGSGYNEGLSRELFHRKCRYYREWLLAPLCGAIIVPYGSFVRFLATCDCLRGRQFFKVHVVGTICLRAVDWFGGATLIFLSVVNFILLSWALVSCYLQGIGFEIFLTFLVSKVWSFLEWFVWSMPYFAYRYPLDKQRFYRKLRRKQEQEETNAAAPGGGGGSVGSVRGSSQRNLLPGSQQPANSRATATSRPPPQTSSNRSTNPFDEI